MPNALSIIGAVALIAVGVAGGLALDRRPVVDVTLPIPFWRPHIALPDGLQARLTAAKAATDRAQRATRLCQDVLAVQGAKVQRQAQLGQVAMALADRDLAAAAGEVRSLRARSSKLETYRPTGVNACARWTDADRAVVEGLR